VLEAILYNDFFRNIFILPLAPFSRRGHLYLFGSENIFFAPLKIMTNQKSPANFWARFSGHGMVCWS